LGTAQFGLDYGITNISGMPTRQEVFGILNLAWEQGIRRFDVAPGYGSETLLGEFISTNGLRKEAIMLTKIPSLKESSDCKQFIKKSLELSLKNIGGPIEVMFFHDPADSKLLLENPEYIVKLMSDYPISSFGVSVYMPHEVEELSASEFELAFQFPFNVLDKRFERVSIPQGKRYARSIFLQGLLASPNILRRGAPEGLVNLQKLYHDILDEYNLDPVGFAVSFVSTYDELDFFLIGVNSEKQLMDILNLKILEKENMQILDGLPINIDQQLLDPRTWSR
jgi:aryl-alcohol dehydrogenase-like predicted oxidoreductase